LFVSLDGGSESSVAHGNTEYGASISMELGIALFTGNLSPVKIGELFFYNSSLGATNDTLSYMTDKWL
jgi:hypothetical protein